MSRFSYIINGEPISLGISAAFEKELINDLEYYKTAQADNLLARNRDWIKYCHNQIDLIHDYINRNTY